VAKARRTPRGPLPGDIAVDDLVVLAEFLGRKPLAGRAMSVAMLDGFFTAIVIGPEVVMPADYLPWIWDWKRGKKGVDFADGDEANRILGCLQAMNNRVAEALMGDPPVVVPLFVFHETQDHQDWLMGFTMGAEFDQEIWDYAAMHAPELFAPFDALARIDRGARGWSKVCPAVSVTIGRVRDYFREGTWRAAFEEVPQPVVRQGPKVGRNDPCVCGSGRKFKKCCGETGGVVH